MNRQTICSKHDEIDSLADAIRDLAKKAKKDGERMEAGLETKRRRIAELEKEVEYLEQKLTEALA